MSLQDFRGMIQDVASRKGWDAALLAAQAWAESGWDPAVIYGPRVSSAGAKGMMQFMDKTWAAFGHGRSVWDPLAALEGAVEYLRHIQAVLGSGLASPLELTLASYNWGEGNVQKLIRGTGRTDWAYLVTVPHPTKPGLLWVPDETRKYVAKILDKARGYAAIFGGTAAPAPPLPEAPAPEITAPDGGLPELPGFPDLQPLPDVSLEPLTTSGDGLDGEAPDTESGWTSYAAIAAIILGGVVALVVLRRFAA